MKDSLTYFELINAGHSVRVEIAGNHYNPILPGRPYQMLNGFVTVSCKALHGSFSAEFMPIDFQMFRQQLALLIYGLEDIAIFEGTMGQLQLRLQECRDHLFEVSVMVCQMPEIGTELNFMLTLARPDIDKLINQLDQILERHSVS